MDITLSIMIPTIGRPELQRLLDELVPQLTLNDEILVIGDGPQPKARSISGLYDSRVRYHEYGPDHCWGHPQRNWAMGIAKGSYLMSMDDDDRSAPTGLSDVRKAALEHPGRPLMFREHHNGIIIWREPSLCLGNVGTQIFVTPNTTERLGVWGRKYEGDWNFIESTLQRYPNGKAALVWRGEVIAMHGTAKSKEAVDRWIWKK